MLAYSSIAHAGYLLVGLIAAEPGRKARGPVLPGVVRESRTSARSVSWRCSAPAIAPHDELNDFKGLWYPASRKWRR